MRSLRERFGGPKKGLMENSMIRNLLGAGVLGDGLGTLGHGMLGEFPRKEEPDSGLDLARGDGGPLVDVGQLAPKKNFNNIKVG